MVQQGLQQGKYIMNRLIQLVYIFLTGSQISKSYIRAKTMLKRIKLFFFRKVCTSEDEYKFLRRFNTNHLTVKYKKYNNVGVYFLPFHFCLHKTKIIFSFWKLIAFIKVVYFQSDLQNVTEEIISFKNCQNSSVFMIEKRWYLCNCYSHKDWIEHITL